HRPDYTIVGAWDPDPGARERAARTFAHVPVRASAQEAIADPRTRVVYVGTPPGWHRHYAQLAAKHGKVLFCEKPLAADLAQGEAMVAELSRANTPNALNYVFATAPGARTLARLLAEGA
ncbi:MAG: Gfo/Idh/MocA family oxidoreductase, partial [Burkholderiaceae bacterium]|nr:Gfo/Idh/MocA family oxidoreductase [Burkholderiaceae bacterium]